MPKLVRIAPKSELPPEGRSCEFLLGAMPICVTNIAGRFTALGGVCPHNGGPLAEGTIEHGNLICPWHGWKFRLADGQCTNRPGASVRIFKLTIHGEDVFLES